MNSTESQPTDFSVERIMSKDFGIKKVSKSSSHHFSQDKLRNFLKKKLLPCNINDNYFADCFYNQSDLSMFKFEDSSDLRQLENDRSKCFLSSNSQITNLKCNAFLPFGSNDYIDTQLWTRNREITSLSNSFKPSYLVSDGYTESNADSSITKISQQKKHPVMQFFSPSPDPMDEFKAPILNQPEQSNICNQNELKRQQASIISQKNDIETSISTSSKNISLSEKVVKKLKFENRNQPNSNNMEDFKIPVFASNENEQTSTHKDTATFIETSTTLTHNLPSPEEDSRNRNSSTTATLVNRNMEDSDKTILKLEFPKPIENKEISRTVHNNSWHLCEDGEETDDRSLSDGRCSSTFSDTCSSVEEPNFSDDSHPLSLVTDKSQMSSRGDDIIKIGNEKSQSKKPACNVLKNSNIPVWVLCNRYSPRPSSGEYFHDFI
ncbi:hypothetical protein CDAR_606581 [Caerostris darwini]|uniref:Uncharacterized protein n=1 Tax=Caerostris darwini TaxID=1538125 RepID=A0AAV4PCT2_9ARAC|nr:hypothetical protein CDAR_606581 [Caerostris darwini]